MLFEGGIRLLKKILATLGQLLKKQTEKYVNENRLI